MLVKQLLYHLSHTSSVWLFWRWGSLKLFVKALPQTVILLISTSQVARITGMSHQCLARGSAFLKIVFYLLFFEDIFQPLLFKN
jgi:hypothetical protein